MSDDASWFFAAFNSAFNSGTKKLLCSWYVMRAWQRALKEKISDEKIQKEVYNELRLFIHLQVKEHFDELMPFFKKTRVDEWAAWARKESLINTNMYSEAFHKQLKHGEDLQGKQNKRVDSIIGTLLKLDGYYTNDRVKKFEKGKITKRLQMINVRHRRMQQMVIEKYSLLRTRGNFKIRIIKFRKNLPSRYLQIKMQYLQYLYSRFCLFLSRFTVHKNYLQAQSFCY
uniref:MULE transposase domain-containing protein n=1 Tax=Strigamia maritima TaxID=126957 RepID=T1ITT1_STRMM